MRDISSRSNELFDATEVVYKETGCIYYLRHSPGGSKTTAEHRQLSLDSPIYRQFLLDLPVHLQLSLDPLLYYQLSFSPPLNRRLSLDPPLNFQLPLDSSSLFNFVVNFQINKMR